MTFSLRHRLGNRSGGARLPVESAPGARKAQYTALGGGRRDRMARRASPQAQRALAFLLLRARPERTRIVVRSAHAPWLAHASHPRLRLLAGGGGRSGRGHRRGLGRRPDRGLPRRGLPGRGLAHPRGSPASGLSRGGLLPHSPSARGFPGRLPRHPRGPPWRRLSGTRPAPARGTPCGSGLPLCSHAHPPFRPGVDVPSTTKGTTHRVFFAARNSCSTARIRRRRAGPGTAGRQGRASVLSCRVSSFPHPGSPVGRPSRATSLPRTNVITRRPCTCRPA